MSLHLLVLTAHEIVEDVHETNLVGLLLETLALKDRVECAVDVCAHLEVFVLHHVVEYFDDADFGGKLFAFVFALASEGQIHEQGRRVLH